MKIYLIIATVFLCISCEFYSSRIIHNSTKYFINIELYKIPSLNNRVLNLEDTIKPYSQYTKITKGKNIELPFFASLENREIDSVVLTLLT